MKTDQRKSHWCHLSNGVGDVYKRPPTWRAMFLRTRNSYSIPKSPVARLKMIEALAIFCETHQQKRDVTKKLWAKTKRSRISPTSSPNRFWPTRKAACYYCFGRPSQNNKCQSGVSCRLCVEGTPGFHGRDGYSHNLWWSPEPNSPPILSHL